MDIFKIKKGIDQIKEFSLTNKEKSKMLHNLSMHVDSHMPVPSPFSIFPAFDTSLGRKLTFTLASILVALLIGGSAAYASENSLPGDLLYPVKTKIVEPIKLALASSPEAKAKVETELADKRLQEAETSDKLGRLTPELKKDLNDEFNSHISKYYEIKKEIEKDQSTSSLEETGKIQTELDNKINQHADILNKFDDNFKNTENAEKKETDKIEGQPEGAEAEIRNRKVINEGREKVEKKDSGTDENTVGDSTEDN